MFEKSFKMAFFAVFRGIFIVIVLTRVGCACAVLKVRLLTLSWLLVRRLKLIATSAVRVRSLLSQKRIKWRFVCVGVRSPGVVKIESVVLLGELLRRSSSASKHSLV